MFCKNCGKEVNEGASICVSCGSKVGNGVKFCQNCGSSTNPNAEVCMSCGFSLKNSEEVGNKSKLVAGLLGIILGGFGVHNFYLGFTAKAVIQLVLTIVGVFICFVPSFIAWIWGLIEGIMIISGKYDKDGKGQLLKD